MSGGLKYTGNGFPPIGLPFSSMLSYGNQTVKALVLRSVVAMVEVCMCAAGMANHAQMNIGINLVTS